MNSARNLFGALLVVLAIGGLVLALEMHRVSTMTMETREKASPPTRTDYSPAGRIEIGTVLYQMSGDLAGTVLDVSNRDPNTGEARKMVQLRMPDGSTEWKTRQTVIRYYQVKPL